MKPFLTLALLTLTATSALAGPDGTTNMALFPGMSNTAVEATDSRVEVRRATAVMDPRDQTRISSGSLWRDGVTNESGMFADRRARHRGDVLTILVAESVNITNSITQQTSKNNAVTNPVLDSYLLNLPGNLHIAKRAVAAAGAAGGTAAATGGPSISSALGLTTSYDGKAQLNSQQSLDTRATVTVADVLPNGNLVVEGTRIVTFSGENKYAQMSGVVRQDDVTPDNTVLSTNIADAKLQFYSEGSLTDAQKKGWLSRGFDRFNPL